jgi:hypothetical protein
MESIRFTTSAGVAGVVGVAGAPAATGEGGEACELALAPEGVDSRLTPPRSGDGGAENDEGTQIGDGSGGWEEVKFPSRAN